MIYKITVDISKILPDLKKRKIGIYKDKFAFIYLEAIDPDEACKKAIEEIFTKISLSFFIYLFQSPTGILSSIKSFIVAESGILNSASAKHIKTTPSLLVNENS